MKKISALLSFILIISMIFTGCSSENNDSTDKTIKVALITSSGGLGDRSFNDSAHEGFKKAEEELGVEIKVIEPQSTADYLQSLKLASSADYDFIMAVGNDWGDAINSVIPNYPDKKFAGVNVDCTGDNLAVARFADHEGSFLVGALASLMSKSGTVGFIGGMDIPGINRFAVGYEEGAKYVNPDIKVLPTYVGSFADPSKGKEFAVQLIDEDADVIYHAASKSGEGLFEALKEKEGVYGIGVDQDQDYIVEGKILTSMVKNVGNAAYDFIKQVKEDTFTSGEKIYGLAENGVGITELKYTKDIIPQEVLDQLDTIKQDIIDGKITVTDVFNK
ncbi:BMP family ABC transporter substrate-binding protein [Vallitalea longa]|uniref:BMP family ABC transporter substrate-binding protein n=1 Tax=Vallitalea longa TaxID=2936439 RepID=A0A9W5YE25_9FIRM|nr:BMP family ABC transporter substrate-binding protein [Vallitalea longa]GKX30638.1 BMP family ABC transporter substrate-binding protein [Vallitalea longa]